MLKIDKTDEKWWKLKKKMQKNNIDCKNGKKMDENWQRMPENWRKNNVERMLKKRQKLTGKNNENSPKKSCKTVNKMLKNL